MWYRLQDYVGQGVILLALLLCLLEFYEEPVLEPPAQRIVYDDPLGLMVPTEADVPYRVRELAPSMYHKWRKNMLTHEYDQWIDWPPLPDQVFQP